MAAVALKLAVPLPLAGRGSGWGSGGFAFALMGYLLPSADGALPPDPPPQGGEEGTLFATSMPVCDPTPARP